MYITIAFQTLFSFFSSFPDVSPLSFSAKSASTAGCTDLYTRVAVPSKGVRLFHFYECVQFVSHNQAASLGHLAPKLGLLLEHAVPSLDVKTPNSFRDISVLIFNALSYIVCLLTKAIMRQGQLNALSCHHKFLPAAIAQHSVY